MFKVTSREDLMPPLLSKAILECLSIQIESCERVQTWLEPGVVMCRGKGVTDDIPDVALLARPPLLPIHIKVPPRLDNGIEAAKKDESALV